MHRSPRTLPAVLFLLLAGCTAGAQDRIHTVVGAPGDQFQTVNTYPEYWVGGKPFFEHAAAFFYHRIPRDRWAEELLHLKAMGVNTIDLYPFWDWHEPEEGVRDFDGHTNPRRDLKYLLRLIDLLGFKLTLRPGPFFCSEWRNGGYPDWLLRRPEYHMSEQAILEGRYPRLSALQYDKSEEAAAGWLKNNTHLKYTREWYANVLGLANNLLPEKGGPLINIQLDDDQAIGRENYNGPNFYKYMDTLRRFAEEATHSSKIPYFINGADMRVNAEANVSGAEPYWNTGQDYQMSGEGGYSTVLEAAKNRFFTEILKTQPLFVPTIIEFQAGWLLDEKDTYARPTDPTNTLMASRVMFQSGLKGLNYYPLNDTLYPAGYESQWGNYFYGWEAAINYAGRETGRAAYVRRNGRLLSGMGPLLAATHFLPDAGLIYPMSTFPQSSLTADEANYVASFAGRVLWSGVYEHFNFEFVDPDHAPAENFERYKVLLVPNLVGSKESLKRYPHLERYSEKAQRAISDYVAAGGTVIFFPSLPKGRLFESLLSPFGTDNLLLSDSSLKFSDGSTALALGGRAVLTLSKKSREEVRVFARDARGGVVGARFAHGQGQIIFFGADFSRWALPPGTTLTFEGGGKAGARDYPEETQKGARAALPALMKEVGVTRKVDPEMPALKPRDLGLYVTELIADTGSRAWEKRQEPNRGYGFVGVTNFSVDEARPAEIVVTDPRATDLAVPEHRLRLPRLTLPPRESLLLPLRVPLANPAWEMAPGLAAGDEVYDATAELTGVHYDGATLRLEFTAPTDGEVTLRLNRPPERATLDDQNAEIRRDPANSLYTVKLPKGPPPEFIRVLQLAYPHLGPRLTISPREPWIAGETRAVRVRVENPGPAPLEGDVDFVAGSIYRDDNPPLSIHTPGHERREFSFPTEIPADVPDGLPVELIATFREKASSTTAAWRGHVTVHQPFTYRLSPVQNFPLREDQAIPIVHPILASLDLPGEATFHVSVKNWLDHEQVITLATSGNGLSLSPSSSQLVLAANAEVTAEVRAAPTGGSGAYPFEITLRSGNYQVKEGVVLAAVRAGEAIAYAIDYDRDGFEDVILENRQVRLFVSPHAGGRSFAFVLKKTNANAFDSVGGMRDNFTTRFEPEDMKGLPEWTRVNWLGLYNRPYSFKIILRAGARAQVGMDYEAPDIYPKGVHLARILTLAGDGNTVLEETTLTPHGVDKPQAYVLETSVPFKAFDQPNYNRWFARGRAPEEFAPGRKIELAGTAGFVGTINKQTGETFALLSLTPAAKTQVVTEGHSALLRVLYPDFARKDEPYTYRAAYFLGKASPEEIENLLRLLKTK
ncbi:MAG: beta-galactosidase [Acidobacteriia bacterium]|nr:beta-galactosidase [Terriglobia bacterium]